MKKDSVKYDTLGYRLFVGAMIIAVLAVLVAGLWLGGSPAQERARRIDAARVSDFQSISNAIDQYYTANSNLPPDLDTLARVRDNQWMSSMIDPDSGEPYEYRIGSGSTYELCSDFSTDSVNVDKRITEPYPADNRFWEHGPKRTCFTITARTFPK